MAVTADQRIKVQSPGKLVSYPAVASVAHYAGTLAFLTTGGYATNVISTTANVFAGIVKTAVTAPASSGDANVECWTEGDFELVGSGFTQGTVGEPIYATDNYVVSVTSTDQPPVGRCVGYVSATRIIVRIEIV